MALALHKSLMLCKNCGSNSAKKNGKWRGPRSGLCQQFVCRECNRHWSVTLRCDFPISRRIKWRVAQATALYAIGLTRSEIKKRTGVASGTLRRNLMQLVDNQAGWNELESFILRRFHIVHKAEMHDLKTQVYACFERLASLRERRWDNYRKEKMRSKNETKELLCRVNRILRTKDRRLHQEK